MSGILSIHQAGRKAILKRGGVPILTVSGISVRYASGYEEIPELRCSGQTENSVRMTADCRNGGTASLSLALEDNSFAMDVDYRGTPLAGESTLRIYLNLSDVKDMASVNLYRPPWSAFPCFDADPDLWPDRKVAIAAFRSGNCHFLFLPLPGNDFSSYLEKGYLTLTTGMDGLTELSGTCLQINFAGDPYTAVREGFRIARHAGRIAVPLRDERRVPAFADYLGWCSWNAMYTDVSEEGLVAKAKEFREKRIPVRWMLIDDGWQDHKDRRIVSLDANKAHFPKGLKHAVDAIKSVNPDMMVGLWITINVYWFGFDPDADITREWADVLSPIVIDGKTETILPGLSPEAAKGFWDRYFGFLRSCGIDFLKLDNQSSYMTELRGTAPHFSQTTVAHRAIEEAALKHFGGDGAVWIINCMGMGQENLFSRPLSSVSRNSTDYYPDGVRNIDSHVVQNAWNAVFHGQMFLPDFDMWTTHHPDAAKSTVLRAISGGPVYTADKVGETEPDYLPPLSDSEGRLYRFSASALPTADLFYTNCRKQKCPVKLFNRAGDDFALAVFPLSDDPAEFTVRSSDLPGADPEASYLMYEYFSQSWTRLDPEQVLTFPIRGDEVLAFSLYRISDEAVTIGDRSAYFPILSKNRSRKTVLELTGQAGKSAPSENGRNQMESGGLTK